MASISPNTLPTPQLLFETATAYQRTEALRAAIELDLFTAMASGAATAREVANHCRASEKGTRALCDYLATLGFLSKQDGAYTLTPESALFLNRKSPAYLGSVMEFFGSSTLMGEFESLSGAVRKGGTVVGELGNMAPEHPVWVQFAHAMAPMTVMAAREIANLSAAQSGEKWKVLDIAAGHGMYGITIATTNPRAEIYAVDWPNVLEVAQANAQRFGLSGRYHALSGNAFSVEFGDGYDLVLLTNFLHHFDVPTCETLLRKVRAALKPGGRAITLEFIPNEDRVTPPIAAQFSLVMVATTPSGDAYTLTEFESMFRNAGFQSLVLHELQSSPERVLVAQA